MTIHDDYLTQRLSELTGRLKVFLRRLTDTTTCRKIHIWTDPPHYWLKDSIHISKIQYLFQTFATRTIQSLIIVATQRSHHDDDLVEDTTLSQFYPTDVIIYI